MARPRGLSLPATEADSVIQEVLVRAKAKTRGKTAVFDTTLGVTREIVDKKLARMRADVNKFGQYVFGHTPELFHRYWNNAVDDIIQRRVPQNKLLLIAPPNSAKSTWNTIIRVAHYIGQHPDHHIIAITSSDDMAKTFDSSIANVLEASEKYRNVFPDKSARPYKKRGWSSDGRYLFGTPEADKDPTYKSVGLNASIMGARANGIILDDPLDQKNAQSEAMQRLAKRYVDQTVIPRLQPDTGWMIAIMTRFHEFDLAAHLIELAKNSGDWLYIRTPMIAEPNDVLGRPVGELLWPSRFNAKYILTERARMTLAEFNMIHQGDPTGMGGDVFKSESWFQELPGNFWEDLFSKCRIVQAWDLAFSTDKRACYTVCITVAIDVDFNIYILDVFRERLTITSTENLMVNSIRIAKPIVVGIEESRFHQQLTRTLVRAVLSRVMCNIQLVQPDKDKYARALLPAARAEAGKIFVNKQTPWYAKFAMECLGFPNTRFKDQVDSFSLVTYLVTRLEELLQEEGRRPEVEHVAS
jgi:predicted phage terminase large subunit-like protein